MREDFELVDDEALRFDGTVERDEPEQKAILFRRTGEPAEWVPRSQIIKIEHDCILVTQWIAEQKGWDDGDPSGVDGQIPF